MSHLTVDPSEIIYAVTMQDILSAIERRLGEEACTLTEDDIRLACEEVKIAIDHNWIYGSILHGSGLLGDRPDIVTTTKKGDPRYVQSED